MTSIPENIERINATLPPSVQLVAVSKFHSEEAVLEAYWAGQRLFGESRAQELERKARNLPTDIRWHFIGHLQTNKVKSVVPYASLIESVDSLKLLCEIDKEAAKMGKVVDCLLEIHVADEESKHGFTFDTCRTFLASDEWRTLSHIRLRGLMGMATFTDNREQVRAEFRSLKNFFNELKNSYFATSEFFDMLSMGMSGDYPIAVNEGATLVRVGTAIFGERQY